MHLGRSLGFARRSGHWKGGRANEVVAPNRGLYHGEYRGDRTAVARPLGPASVANGQCHLKATTNFPSPPDQTSPRIWLRSSARRTAWLPDNDPVHPKTIKIISRGNLVRDGEFWNIGTRSSPWEMRLTEIYWMKNQRKSFSVFMACLGGILTGATAIVRAMSLFVIGVMGYMFVICFDLSGVVGFWMYLIFSI